MINIGDNVRFLNAVGGGKVVKIDAKNNLVYVQDEDGFDIPALVQECVVVGPVNETTNFPRKDFKSEVKPEIQQPVVVQPVLPVIEEPILETPEGEELKVFLAFFPTDIKRINDCGYECYLVNDSNYFLFYNIVVGEENQRKSVVNKVIEPNMQELVYNLRKEELNGWARARVQVLPFKKDKVYTEQQALDFVLKLSPVKFYKLHSFDSSDYFEDPHLLIDLVQASEKKQFEQISTEEVKIMMHQKEITPKNKKFELKKKKNDEIVEIDLHINQLLDSTVGMDNAEILSYQMDAFRKALETYKRKKGQRIVFIHGKGEGVLRKEIEKELRAHHNNYTFQDASFKEYGFGATMVIIR